jgi:molecular chaperone GrpE (heat shock protein)
MNMTEENLDKFMDNEEPNERRGEEATVYENEADKVDKVDKNAAGEGSGFGSDVEALESEIESLKNQLAAARADLYNFRQRTERERAKSRKLIAEDKIIEFMPVLDNLDRALAVPEDGSAKDVLIGVRMVQRQFLSVMENSEVTIIQTEGCPFDPMLHDAVETEFVEEPDRNGAVLCELLRGYRTPDRVLRPAQVRVGRLRS